MRADIAPATAAPRRFADGAVITRLGEHVASPAVVERGIARASVLAEDGREAVVALLGPGEVFDECALLAPATSLVEVRAVGATAIRRVDARASPLEVALARRLRAATDLLEEVMLHDVRSRLVRRLGDVAARRGVGPLPLTQEELGRMVGASRETVNRALRALAADGAIDGRWSRG